MVRAQPVHRVRAVDHLLGCRRRTQHMDVRRDMRGDRGADSRGVGGPRWTTPARGGDRRVLRRRSPSQAWSSGPRTATGWTRYATTLSSGVLAAMSLGSLAFVPFTAQYAPESAPQQDWEKAAFRRTNQVLTLMWALVFALIAVLGYVAVEAPLTVDWTKAVIPVGGDRRGDRDDADLSRPGTGERQAGLNQLLLSAYECR